MIQKNVTSKEFAIAGEIADRVAFSDEELGILIAVYERLIEYVEARKHVTGIALYRLLRLELDRFKEFEKS